MSFNTWFFVIFKTILKRNLLFSKREKADKSTSMGDEQENMRGLLGINKNNQFESDIDEERDGTKKHKDNLFYINYIM